MRVPRKRAEMQALDVPTPWRCVLGFHKWPSGVKHNVGVRCAREGCGHVFPGPRGGVAVLPVHEVPPEALPDMPGIPPVPMADNLRMMGAGEEARAIAKLAQALGVGAEVTYTCDSRGDGDELRVEFPTVGTFVVWAPRLRMLWED